MKKNWQKVSESFPFKLCIVKNGWASLWAWKSRSQLVFFFFELINILWDCYDCKIILWNKYSWNSIIFVNLFLGTTPPHHPPVVSYCCTCAQLRCNFCDKIDGCSWTQGHKMSTHFCLLYITYSSILLSPWVKLQHQLAKLETPRDLCLKCAFTFAKVTKNREFSIERIFIRFKVW